MKGNSCAGGEMDCGNSTGATLGAVGVSGTLGGVAVGSGTLGGWGVWERVTRVDAGVGALG